MSPRSYLLDDATQAYLVASARPADDVLERLQVETAELPMAGMQISPEQGALLEILTRMVGATSAIEVGTFTGYSSICIARGLAPGGRLLCCDVSEEWTAIARHYWAEADLGDRIDLELAPALETISALEPDRQFDLVFIDAVKTEYWDYLEALTPHLHPGSIVLVDNVLWSGTVVASPEPDDPADTVALRAFNERLVADARFETVLLPVGDGLTLARRR